jgi:hypothetical protein
LRFIVLGAALLMLLTGGVTTTAHSTYSVTFERTDVFNATINVTVNGTHYPVPAFGDAVAYFSNGTYNYSCPGGGGTFRVDGSNVTVPLNCVPITGALPTPLDYQPLTNEEVLFIFAIPIIVVGAFVLGFLIGARKRKPESPP